MKKSYPEDRFLSIKYYHSGRVHQLLAPVGADEHPVATHTFEYKFDKNHSTSVLDAHGHQTLYSYDKDHKRLNCITRFDKKKNIEVKVKLFWGADQTPDEGNLVGRVFEENGKVHFFCKYVYDSFGNIQEERLWGNLTGKGIPLTVDDLGTPKGGEVHTKSTLFSQNSWNLPMEENDGRKTLIYTYYSQTNRLKSRLTKSGQIVKREYFEYDDNGVVIKEIVDDGVNEPAHDLTGVTERHVKIITPSTVPLGLPEVIEERHQDLKMADNYPLIKKTVNQYTPQGWLTQQVHYGSDGELACPWSFHAFQLSLRLSQ